MRPNMTGDWPWVGRRIFRMPALLSGLVFSVLASNALTFGLAGSAFAISAISYGIVAAAAIGLQLAFRQKPPTPQASDVQSNIRQAISARRRIYGRYLTGSVIVFGFRRGEKSYLLHYIGEGPIEGYVSFRLDKKPVTLDEDGFVQEEQYQDHGHSVVQILYTTGLMTDEPFQAILDAFPELDDPLQPFRHRGCAMVLQIVEQVGQQDLAEVYPNNMPSLQVVVDGLNDIIDPSNGLTGYSDNAGLCLLAEALNVYGLTYADNQDDVNFAAFAEFADLCDEDVDLKAGGTEKRYRSAGVVAMNAENEDRIKALAAVCNADVFLDTQGRISVRQKLRLTPGIALRAKNGDHLAVQLEGGRIEQKKFNTVKVSYVDPALNWKDNEVSWRHEELYEADGEVPLTEQLQLPLCPSATQAQRLAKLYLHEGNPEFVGSLNSGPQALDLCEDYAFTLDLAPEEDFERVACANGPIDYDGERMVVTAPFVVYAEDAADWDPEIDEQSQVVVPPILLSNIDDVALDVTVAIQIVNGAPILLFSWEAAGAGELPTSYSQQVQVSAADADDWGDASVNQDNDTAQFAPVANGAAYDWRIRNIANGKKFDWQTSTVPVGVAVTPPRLDFSAGPNLILAG